MVALVPFQLPAPQVPFVMLAGTAGDTAVKVLLDTGDATPFTVVISERSKAAHEARVSFRNHHRDYVTHAVAGGRVARIQPARLKSFHLGPIQLKDVDAGLSTSVDTVASRLPGGVDAFIGYQFLADRVVAIDYAAHTVDFDARPGPAERALAMTLAPRKPLTVIEATVNAQGPFRLVIDTGASGTILSPQAARRAGVGTGGMALQLGGAGGADQTGRLERASVAVGAQHWDKAPIIVADLMGPVSEESGMALDGVLGAAQLARGTLILDYRTKKVWIGEGAETQ